MDKINVKLLKLPMNWKIIAAYWKDLKISPKYRRIVFSFLEHIFFYLRDIVVLFKLGRWWHHPLCNLNSKILNKEYLWTHWSSVLQTWRQKCESHKHFNSVDQCFGFYTCDLYACTLRQIQNLVKGSLNNCCWRLNHSKGGPGNAVPDDFEIYM